jgi:hypothetical protein
MNKAVLRPLVDKYYDMDDLSVGMRRSVTQVNLLTNQCTAYSSIDSNF